ncbi:hypothetical protein P8C59_000492 [Phyllachora maydis]|uniref:Signal recognition particle receptor subunit beta n=1 Tax=Phyllachora maydis TaxID=1825666 RepID=A0AAD9HWG1_9PEZI|nr:hypothetical protein P8C59_000492 [Phyllachora maydis]
MTTAAPPSQLPSLAALIKTFFEASLSPSPTVFAIGLLLVFLGPVLLHLLVTRASPSALPSVLLVGPSGAGKTALLTLYERGPAEKSAARPSPTHTSLRPSSVELAVHDGAAAPSSYRDDLDAAAAAVARRFLLVDTPGHPKLRRQALLRLAALRGPGKGKTAAGGAVAGDAGDQGSRVQAVVFMVDAAALGEVRGDAQGRALAAAADYLHDVLLTLQKRPGAGRSATPVPVLVAANKLDLFTALPPALVKSKLETEITRVRRTRSKGLKPTGLDEDDPGHDEDWLGELGQENFTLDQMLGHEIHVDVVGGSLVGHGPGADAWWDWLASKI